MDMVTKTLNAEYQVKESADGAYGIFSGYASTPGIDRAGDQIMSGAWGAFAAPEKVKMLRQHDHARLCGRYTTIREDSKGLYVDGRLSLKVRDGMEAYELMKDGVLTDMSVGFEIMPGGYKMSTVMVDGKEQSVFQITKARLNEISLVAIPCNSQATIDAIKSLCGKSATKIEVIADEDLDCDDEDAILADPRKLEKALRNAGMPRAYAKALIADGVSGFHAVVQSVLAQTLCLQNGNVKAIMQHGLKKSIKPLVQVTQRDADVADLPLNPSKSLAYLFPR
jgi:uncharacterized protein